MTKIDPVKAVLERHGISDPTAYLLNEGRDSEIIPSRDPDIKPRGNIFLMLGKIIDMKDISARLGRLKRA